MTPEEIEAQEIMKDIKKLCAQIEEDLKWFHERKERLKLL
jgi:hypothetical protein